MPFIFTREDFLAKAGVTEQDWEKSCLDWEQLLSIANHHEAAIGALTLHGGNFANRIQAFAGVHSVRWRIKNTYGLIKKIVRKNLEDSPNEKWKNINCKNYREVVSDLIGVRARHLLREDCITIDEQLRAIYDVYDVTIFKRVGDPELSEILQRGAVEKIHDIGYRSIHYGLNYTGEKEPITVEFQVRTVFQEGWSEIDHQVRYPDFSENELLKYFIGVFNGLAGTADDMGTFVIKLHSLISATEATILESEVALAAKDSDIDKLQQEIDKLKANGTTPATSIESLQSSVDKIKAKSIKENNYALASRLVSDIYKPTSFDIEKIKSLVSGISTDAKLINIINNISQPNATLKKLLDDVNKPNAALVAALEQIKGPNSAITAAMESINRTNSAMATALKEFNRSNAAINKALEKPATLIDSYKSILDGTQPLLPKNDSDTDK
ncbi:hypothetical protein J3P88_11770 [Pseudomonas sp. Z3-6]|uniref:hypothetical protein n=1 Tax=Pseudomonas sp. Z3-6 TaxID=2817411 RepID=UPI003DA8DE34